MIILKKGLAALADRYPEYLWGNMESYQYGACMAEHGQEE
jgi:hypothetical protein